MLMRKDNIICYSISGVAVAWFFLFPDPSLAVIGALVLQTIAFISIGGRSKPDSIILTGISLLLIGLLSEDNPLIHGPFYSSIQPWIISAAVTALLVGILLRVGKVR